MSEPAFPNDSANPLHSGMSLRDYFAAAALQGMCADSSVTGSWDKIAMAAYAASDAMLAQRNKK